MRGAMSLTVRGVRVVMRMAVREAMRRSMRVAMGGR